MIYSCAGVTIVNSESDEESNDINAYSYFAAEPEAKQEDDNKNTGIYKGTLIGSTGHYKIIIKSAGSNDIKLEILYTNESGALSGVINGIEVQDAGGYIYTFNGNLSGKNINFIIRILNDGTIDEDNSHLTITGNEILIKTIKEESDVLVRVFEGKFYENDGSEICTWNCIIYGDNNNGTVNGIWKYIAPKEGYGYVTGTLESNCIINSTILKYNEDTGSLDPNGNFNSGPKVINSNNISGIWTYGIENGIWSGHRTL